ncbi:MAG: DNA gyrase inhibitor YacG [Planctomycetaceae bacterium]|nr:DNA gyrase inhibitor YacG [Planctomycetaceae bacterium]
MPEKSLVLIQPYERLPLIRLIPDAYALVFTSEKTRGMKAFCLPPKTCYAITRYLYCPINLLKKKDFMTSNYQTEKPLTCPVCEKIFSIHDEHIAMPFCSLRCKQIDAMRWFNEQYSMPIEKKETDDFGELE